MDVGIQDGSAIVALYLVRRLVHSADSQPKSISSGRSVRYRTYIIRIADPTFSILKKRPAVKRV